jgi:Cu/Ag efflux protein CusF
MSSKRHFFAVIGGAVLAATLFAHGGAEHITGVVKATNADSIVVETLKHETVTVLLTPKTESLKSNVKASLKELRPGDRVVIHAVKNKAGAYEASEVQWGPVPAATQK